MITCIIGEYLIIFIRSYYCVLYMDFVVELLSRFKYNGGFIQFTRD